MEAIDLGEGLTLFMFEPPRGGFEGLNLLALVDGGRAMLLDAGYERNMRNALAWLEGRGARPTAAIVSHYHIDHADGLSVVPGLETWGSARYAETLVRCFRAERRASLAPTHPIGGPALVRFGGHEIELFPLPGHTPDSLGAVIDGRVLYAADTLLYTNDGEPILPSVHARPVSLHAEAVRRLGDYVDLTFVPGHGAPVTDRGARERDLANRLSYLEAIAASPGISLDDAQAGCRPRFLGSAWHEENWR